MAAVDFNIDVTNDNYDINHEAIQADPKCIEEIEKQRILMKNFLDKFVANEISSVVTNAAGKKIKIVRRRV